MQVSRKLLLSTYYYGTFAWRQISSRLAARAGRAPVMVLFYHRVADYWPNDWTLSTRQFARHVRWLKRHFELVSLADAQDRIRSASNPRPVVSITFDDGYADNCDFALPLLNRERIPCTYFVSTDHVCQGRPFPHDQSAGRPLRTNTIAQLRQWADAGIEIGAHTRTHADLGKVTDPAQLYDELVTSRDDLSQAIGRPIRFFAFPYGQLENMSAAAIALARDSQFEAICSAYGGYNFPGDDGFHLQRIHGDPDLVRFKNWLTVDPRKLGRPLFADESSPDRGATDHAPAGAGAGPRTSVLT